MQVGCPLSAMSGRQSQALASWVALDNPKAQWISSVRKLVAVGRRTPGSTPRELRGAVAGGVRLMSEG